MCSAVVNLTAKPEVETVAQRVSASSKKNHAQRAFHAEERKWKMRQIHINLTAIVHLFTRRKEMWKIAGFVFLTHDSTHRILWTCGVETILSWFLAVVSDHRASEINQWFFVCSQVDFLSVGFPPTSCLEGGDICVCVGGGLPKVLSNLKPLELQYNFTPFSNAAKEKKAVPSVKSSLIRRYCAELCEMLLLVRTRNNWFRVSQN